MLLTRLDIKGFKSFGDKTTIHFNQGVTAIVGPNGCGKSNIVDAIRWALGEQSTRILRSEKMENVIFNGTKTRKQSNLAEVSLTFENTKNILPTAFTQITLTRKLYRTGESEYRLNDVHCRLKDITDLFLDTGVSPDSYSIIELKMIDEIIADKEGSRKTLFEEASGISKYRLRKKQTFSKLKDTETDLNRVNDILFEIEKNLKTLETQAKKTERYYQLKEEYKLYSLQLASFQLIALDQSLEKLDEQEKTQHLEKLNLNTQIDILEADLQRQKLDHLTKEKNLSTGQKALNEYIAQIRSHESDQKLKTEQLRFIEEKKTRLTEALERDRNQLNQIHDHLQQLNNELILENQSLKHIQENLKEYELHVEQTRAKQQENKLTLDHLIKENESLQNQFYKLEKDLTILGIQKEALLQESKRNLQDTNHRTLALDEFKKVISTLQFELQSKQSTHTLLQKLEDDIEQNIEASKELINVNEEHLHAKNRLLDAKNNEYKLLKSLLDSLEGFPESIRFLKKNMHWASHHTPLLSDIFFCREEYRIPIENYLEPVMNHYVVETQIEAVHAIQLLNKSSKGRAHFFILDAIHKPIPSQPLPTNAHKNQWIPALQVIDVEPKYQALCESLLQHVYLLQTNENEELESTLPNQDVILLSRTGQFSKSRISLSGGSIGLFDGKRIGRAKNLESLGKDITLLEEDITRLKQDINQENQKLNTYKSASKKQEIQQIQTDINKLLHELTLIETKEEQHLSFIQNSQNRKHDIEEKITSIDQQILLITPELHELKSQQQLKADLLAQQKQTYTEVTELLTHHSATYNQENIRFHQQQNKVANSNRDIHLYNEQEQRLTNIIASHDQELTQARIDIRNILQHSKHNNEDLSLMYAEKESMEEGLHELEQLFYTSRGLTTETEEKIARIRKNKEQVDLLVNEIKDKKNGLKIELNALKERLSIEFAIDIHNLLDTETPQEEKEEAIRERVNRLKQKLDEFGTINPMAMEAYREINERHTFIQTQKQDLLDAKTSLMQTIKEIDDTAREKFMSTFISCRAHFMNVFRSLFNEEDSCDLILSNPDNPLESDIDIVAKPKGKRPLSINQLSGGEKTLTATALLFSLYLLKPAPFCIFDEVDAPLDDTNIDKFNTIIRQFSNQSQFIVVSHNKRTIANTDIIYGVTMVEQGVSQIVAVDMCEAV